MPDIPDEWVEKGMAALEPWRVCLSDEDREDSARAVLEAVQPPNAINRWENLDRRPEELAETIRRYAPQTYAYIDHRLQQENRELRRRLHRVRELCDQLIEQGDDHVPGCEGQADCAACIHHDLRAALEGERDG